MTHPSGRAYALTPPEQYVIWHEPDGSTTVRIAPGASVGEPVRQLLASWHQRQLVGQVHRLPAHHAADMAPGIERRLCHQIVTAALDQRVVPVSLPRPRWMHLPQELGAVPEITAEDARRMVDWPGATFTPGVTPTGPGDVAVCYVEVAALPAAAPE